MQDDLRLAARRPRYFDVQPSNLRAPAAPQRFHHRLLGGEATGITLVAPAPFLLAVLNFLGREHTVAEASTDARVFQRPLDALDFSQIDTDAHNHGRKGSASHEPLSTDIEI